MQLRKLGRTDLEISPQLLGAIELKLDEDAMIALNTASEW